MSASLLQRVRDLVTAHSHDALDRVEDPQVMAQQILRDLEAELARIDHALVKAGGTTKLLERQQAQARQEADRWRLQARRMLEQQREDLARSALDRALDAETQARDLEPPLANAKRTAERLREQAQLVRREWDGARRRCVQITANQRTAQALGVAGRLGDVHSRSLERAQRLERLSLKSAEWDCDAEAATELLGEHQRLEREVGRVDRSAALDTELAALKLAMAPQAP